MYPVDIYQALADFDRTTVGEVEALGAVLLALPPEQHSSAACRSSLNNDGSPLQLCITSSRHGCSARLIGDPGCFMSTIRQRIERSREALLRLSTLSGSPSFDSLSNRLLRMIVPKYHLRMAGRDTGIIWLASATDKRSAASYINARWASVAEDWSRAHSCLRSILPHAEEAQNLVNGLKTTAQLASIGVETTSSDDMRLKLYWRLATPTLLRMLSVPLLHHPAIHRFFATIMSNQHMPVTGLVFSAGFLFSTGELEDVKADLCAHCLPRPITHWLDAVEEVAEQNGLSTMEMRACLKAGTLEPAFLGLGVNRSNQIRMNLYLKSAHV